MNIISLIPGETYHHSKITSVFGGQTQGGMRRNKDANTLHLIIDHTKPSPYQDKWVGDIIHYCGMGQTKEQNINGAQNKTLNESNINGAGVYLSEVFKKTYYHFQGRVKLVAEPYQEQQLDKNGDLRNVWIFPLQLIDKHNPVDKFKLAHILARRVKKNKGLTADELIQKIDEKDKRKPGKRSTRSNYYQRDEDVISYTLLRAKGICELCEERAPFVNSDGTGFLEVHHIQHLANDGDDNIENTVALCPNCHRKMHILGSKKDINKLEKINKLIHSHMRA